MASACAAPAAGVPKPDHVVVVIEENTAFSDIVGNKAAPYINRLAVQGALMEESYALTHPSLPNYLALFSGSTQGVRDDGCRYKFQGQNLAEALEKAGFSFAIFSEDLPKAGSRTCGHGGYRKKHNPVAYFTDLSAEVNRPLGDFPSDFSRLPTVAFVVPTVANDMHDGSIARADSWLREHLDPYVQWAKDHHSLLILTWDEDDTREQNHIVTLFVGAGVRTGRYKQRIDHYDVLSTLAAFYGLPAPGESGGRKPITGIWTK
ncbi:MAG: alkaline phosphatase family protein [Arenicellales bacterium]